jgi:hypothetical protein
MRELVERELRSSSEFKLLDPWEPGDGLAALRAQRPDVAIVPAGDTSPSAYEQALDSLDGTECLEIGGDSRRFVLRRVVMNPDAVTLLEAIRNAAGRAVAGGAHPLMGTEESWRHSNRSR